MDPTTVLVRYGKKPNFIEVGQKTGKVDSERTISPQRPVDVEKVLIV